MQRIVLFDLGGVLADLGDPAAAMQLDMRVEAFWQVWLNAPAVRAFERGRLDIDEFCERIAAELGLPDGAAARECLERWQLTLYEGVEQLIADTRAMARVALLSNTNALHWSQVTADSDVFDDFDALFLSYETGYFKPAAGAFEQVVAHYACAPHDIAFLDDTPVNVDAAKAAGMQAYCVKGPLEARKHLFGA